MYIENEHVQNLLNSKQAVLLSLELAKEFGNYLEGLPWNVTGSGLDWTRLDGQTANLSQMDFGQLCNWVNSTSLRHDSHLVFWFGADEPCIACALDFGLQKIDEIFWKAPGRRQMFGAFSRGEVLEPSFFHLMEYDGADRLKAIA